MQQIYSAQIKMQDVQLTIQYIILSKYISNWNKKASSGTKHFYDVGRQDLKTYIAADDYLFQSIKIGIFTNNV